MGLQNTMRALADPIRREILSMLKRGRMSAGDIVSRFDVSYVDVAGLCGFEDQSYFTKVFKKETGQTLTEYVTGKRIEHAIFLLNCTNMQIQTIAQYCGIPDICYFTKIFKKIVGKSPSEYKNTIRH